MDLEIQYIPYQNTAGFYKTWQDDSKIYMEI